MRRRVRAENPRSRAMSASVFVVAPFVARSAAVPAPGADSCTTEAEGFCTADPPQRVGAAGIMTTIVERPRATGGSDFAALNRRIAEAGLLERRPAYYTVRLSVVAAMLAGGWAAFVLIGASWWTLTVAALLGIVFSQVALVAHDLAHRQVFRTKKPSERAGRIAANIAVGMSYGWGVGKNTPPHKNPQH